MARRLLLLNGLAIIAVILHHTAAYGLQAMFEWTNRYREVAVPNYDQIGTLSFYALLAVRLLDRFALPAFLMVSGYFIAFMARGSTGNVTWQQLWPRIRILLIPFALWTIARYVLLRRPPSSIDDVMDPYHFIPVLIQFYLLSPLIVPLARKNWRLLLGIAALLQLLLLAYRSLFVLGMEIPLQAAVLAVPGWVFPEFVFWFPLGVVAGLHSTTVSRWLARHRRLLLVSLLVVSVLSFVEYGVVSRLVDGPWAGSTFRGITGPLYSLVFLFAFLSLDEKSLPLPKQVADLGLHSLGIYMANIPAIYIIAVLLYHLTPWVLGNQLIYQTILIAAGLGVPLLLMEMIRRSPARGTYKYIFG